MKTQVDFKNVMKKPNSNNCTWFDGFVTCKDRERLHGHKGAVVWFTGLSASGKSTIAHHLEKLLPKTGISSPYEPPEHPDLSLRSLEMSPMDSALTIISLLEQRNIVSMRAENPPSFENDLLEKESPC